MDNGESCTADPVPLGALKIRNLFVGCGIKILSETGW